MFGYLGLGSEATLRPCTQAQRLLRMSESETVWVVGGVASYFFARLSWIYASGWKHPTVSSGRRKAQLIPPGKDLKS